MPKRVCKFKITLNDIKPPIWRRILVPENYTFWDLHVAIQDAMGWDDYHLFLFHVRKKGSKNFIEIGIPDQDRFEDDIEILPCWNEPISDHFQESGDVCIYDYDFGDCWEHKVLFEGFLTRETGQKYPQLIAGKRACPPEDCGGVPGYENLLNIISNPNHEEFVEMILWLGKKFDPDEFDNEKVKFHNPKRRFKTAFPEGY